MELPQRKGQDRYLPPGKYKELEASLRSQRSLQDVRTLIISTLDRRARMLPFVYFDRYMVPAGPRAIAAVLYEVGMHKTRLVYQLWNPNIDPTCARIDGAAPDVLMISVVQVHAAPAYALIRRAWTMGENRPLIIVGGPKACYEPFDFFGLGKDGQFGADVVVTGEEPVLLELLTVLGQFGGGSTTMRHAFQRAVKADALAHIPGLVYGRDGRNDGRNLINTGVQRLLRDLDELPLLTSGFRMLEPPHRHKSLREKPIPLEKACKGLNVAAILVTRGCKYNCHFCPIPAYNQRSYRRKSPQRLVEEFVEARKRMNTRYFFGTDDNFFNSRRYVVEVLEAMAAAQVNGKALGRQIRFATEATVTDVYKNRDLLPLARHGKAGMDAIWMGVEDLAARLVDKGQKPGMTEVLFAEMLANDITPMAMLMHYDDQPLRSPGKLVGLLNQIRFIQRAGALSMQCTVASPATGSRWINQMYKSGLMYESVGGRRIRDGDFDGNHVVAGSRPDPWRVQWNLLRGYAAFYNPINFARGLAIRKRRLARKTLTYQLWGMAALVRTAWRLKGHLWRLWKGPIIRAKGWPARYCRPGSPYPQLIGDGDRRGADQGSSNISPANMTGEGKAEGEPQSVSS